MQLEKFCERWQSRLKQTLPRALVGSLSLDFMTMQLLKKCFGPRMGRGSGYGVAILAGALLVQSCVFASQTAKSRGGLSYQHEELPEGPWSTHVVKIDRSNPDYEIHSALAAGDSFGLATLTDHIKMLPRDLGRPVAGLNGDFFRRRPPYLGDPKGLQIVRGELVSAPCDWSCFWIDAQGNPQITNVLSQLEVTWPNGVKTPFGLNEARPHSGAMLYTPAVGKTTQTSGGRELILERNGSNEWLPLKPGVSYTARVRAVSTSGNSTLSKDTMVLSIGKQLIGKIPSVRPGTVLHLSTATSPDLTGATTGIGGGPAIVRDGKVIERTDANVRHPRAAIGWNKDHYFLVEVDGRQLGVSVGMTIRELAEYLVRIGCTDALNLDGGGSATLWVYGQVMNNPSQGDERGMGNAVVVVHKEKK